MRSDIHIRWLIRRDMREVMAIEHGSFEFPWDERDFIECLRQRNCIGMVAELHGVIAGYMVYELCRDRIKLLSIAVDPNLRRLGVGTSMMDKLKSKLSHIKRREIVFDVRETNLSAQLFFRAVECKAIGINPNLYRDTDEDAYLFSYSEQMA